MDSYEFKMCSYSNITLIDEASSRIIKVGFVGSAQETIASKWNVPSHLSGSKNTYIQGSNTSLLTALAETIHAHE
jgi:hypothetical protein